MSVRGCKFAWGRGSYGVSALGYFTGKIESGSRWSQLLNAQLREPLAKIDALCEGLALHDTGGETTGESITANS